MIHTKHQIHTAACFLNNLAVTIIMNNSWIILVLPFLWTCPQPESAKAGYNAMFMFCYLVLTASVQCILWLTSRLLALTISNCYYQTPCRGFSKNFLGTWCSTEFGNLSTWLNLQFPFKGIGLVVLAQSDFSFCNKILCVSTSLTSHMWPSI